VPIIRAISVLFVEPSGPIGSGPSDPIGNEFRRRRSLESILGRREYTLKVMFTGEFVVKVVLFGVLMTLLAGVLLFR
jgi:hypothetical protein